MTDLPASVIRRRIVSFAAVLAASPVASLEALAAKKRGYGSRADVQRWARSAAREHRLSYKWIVAQLNKARHVAASAKIMNQPRLTAGKNPDDWLAHRAGVMNEKRLAYGREFVARHRKTLAAVEKRWGVPAATVAGIIGVESNFGRNQGGYRTLDVLATLSFDHKRRAEFFRRELGAYLKLCRRTKTDPAVMKGSFAGAVGMCQFMPSNIAHYGVDFDGDGHIDLNNSVKDAAASVANYLKKSGWTPGLPAAWTCEVTRAAAARHKRNPMKPDTTLGAALRSGVKLTEACRAPADTPVMLVRLRSPKGDAWRLATVNFTAILRYNRSYFYAESVRELGLTLLDSPAGQTPQPQPQPEQSRAQKPHDKSLERMNAERPDTIRSREEIIEPNPRRQESVQPAPTKPAAGGSARFEPQPIDARSVKPAPEGTRTTTEIVPPAPEHAQAYAIPMDDMPEVLHSTTRIPGGGSLTESVAMPEAAPTTAPASAAPKRAYDWSGVPVTPAVAPALWD